MTIEKKTRTSTKKEDSLPFEERLERLQEIIALLEKGNIPLQDSLNLYKEGLTHSKKCQQLIDSAEHEIKLLQNNDDNDGIDFKIKE